MTRVVYLDASDSGYGGYFVEIGPEIAHGMWSKDGAAWSSTWRELKAIYRVLCSLVPILKGHTERQSKCHPHCTNLVVENSISKTVQWPFLKHVFSMG